MTIKNLGHINIVVENIDESSDYYCTLLNGQPVQRFNRFNNDGFSKSAGFLYDYKDVDVSIEFIEIDNSGVFLELMQYHNPVGDINIIEKKTNTIGGVGHICLKVENISQEFKRIKDMKGVRFIVNDNDYQPYRISPITIDDFYFLDDNKENDIKEKEAVVDIINGIKYFYFVDKYGIQWEFEEGHADIG
ncbi:glyoxalase/Bleomycin resistance protein/dioxygenase superfamily [Vibrio alginolyticus]|nr:glyoxalase/Bleomycin resistance protein/dioxygenase superfamily [Vibrio alginolyticus]